MTQNNHLYKKFSCDSSTITKFFPYYKTLNELSWYNLNGFLTLDIPKGIWLKEPLLELINKQYSIAGAVFLKISTNTCYSWHKDHTRGLSINMLMEESNSFCLFGDKIDDYNYNTIKLDYELGKFYLFNTQHEHCVINFDQPRFLFSIEFEQEKDDLSYQDVYNWCLNQGLFYE